MIHPHPLRAPGRAIRRARRAGLAALLLLATACSSSDDGAQPTTTPPPAEATTTTAAAGEDATTAGDELVELEPGDVRFRVMNLLDVPVDLYGRTTGTVRAQRYVAGLAPEETSDLFAPPADGQFVISDAGAGDPTCVATCPHLMVMIPDAIAGPVQTLVLYEDTDGERTTFDLWEAPIETGSGYANSMPPADPDRGLAVVSAPAVTGTDFGLQLAFDGVDGCQAPLDDPDFLVGGPQNVPFAYDGAEVSISFFDSQDLDCSGEAVGGPFTVSGGPGTRQHVVLHGSPGDLKAIVLPMTEA